MNNKEMNRPQKTTFTFDYCDSNKTHPVSFDSSFDSGNCSLVHQIAPNKYDIHTANDCAGLENEGYSRSWFYFSVEGFPNGTSVEFNVWRINMVYGLRKYADVYRPVYKLSNESTWNRIDQPVQFNIRDEKLVVTFEFTFENLSPGDKVYFAFSYPYSYEDCQKYLSSLQKQFLFDSDIYFHRETLVKSPEDRNIDLVTITSHEGKLNEREPYFKESLFPNRKNEKRAFKFRENKPVILLTARVHPGETPASHAMNGIIKFLLDKNDARAYLLRKYFVFMLIPMINPDGVYNGYYRMDIFNQNLNRYYNQPKITKQPAIFAIRHLVGYLKIGRKLIFYCDLHAHSARKGCFLFGNAINDYVSQVESQLYAKVVSLNCINFEYNHCIFSKKHMKSKDRYERLTKEGCGRVVVHKICSLVHSYTLECGFHLSTNKAPLSDPMNPNKMINGKMSFVEDSLENINDPYYQSPTCFFTIEAYENVGKSLLISFLDIFEKNPYSRIENTKYKKISSIRKEIATNLIVLDRFKKTPQNFKKLRNIEEAAYENFFQQFQARKVFEVPDHHSGFVNNFKSQTQEEKKLMTKSGSFRDKETKSVNLSFKTPGKKTFGFHSNSKMDNFQVKSESNILEDDKNEIWEKEKENEELINELKEELEEEADESELSCDSEEYNDEEIKEYSVGKPKIKNFGMTPSPTMNKNNGTINSNIKRIKEKGQSESKNNYMMVHRSQQNLDDVIAVKNKPKSNEFEPIGKIINYPPFIREKKKKPAKINVFQIRKNSNKRGSLSLKTEKYGIGVFGKNQWKLPDININNLNVMRQKQIEQDKIFNSRKLKV